MCVTEPQRSVDESMEYESETVSIIGQSFYKRKEDTMFLVVDQKKIIIIILRSHLRPGGIPVETYNVSVRYEFLTHVHTDVLRHDN